MNFKIPNCVLERVNFIECKLYLNKPELHSFIAMETIAVCPHSCVCNPVH